MPAPDFALMIGKRLSDKDGSAPPDDTPPDNGDQDQQMQLSAMGAFIDAVHMKDAAAALDAYKQLCEMVEMSEGEDGSKEEY